MKPTWRRTRCPKPVRTGDRKERGRLRRFAYRAGRLARGSMPADDAQLGVLPDPFEDKIDPYDNAWGHDR